MTPAPYAETAQAAWRWVLDQVRWDDGPWIPESVSVPDAASGDREVPGWRDGMHSGVGGLAHTLAEIRLARPWTTEEAELADAIAERVRRAVGAETEANYFDGLVSSLGVLTALDAPGGDDVLARLLALATPDGWPQTAALPPRYLPDARINDVTLGTAGVLLAGLWGRRAGLVGSDDLSSRAVDVLLAEAEHLATGTTWPFVPLRFRTKPGSEMPNWSHGLAGVAAALALAGAELDRPDLVDLARSGAEHLVTLADPDPDPGSGAHGFVVPRSVPDTKPGDERLTFNWCHGPAGTSLLFLALDHAGVDLVAGRGVLEWHRRCLTSVVTSGLPERRHPGFWDNDGRCCGTAGVGDVFLDSWQRGGEQRDLDFAIRLADALVARAVTDGPHTYWRFVEHRNAEPLLPPGVGWMQGAAGIAAHLFRVSRVLRDGRDGRDAPAVRRLDTWWALPR